MRSITLSGLSPRGYIRTLHGTGHKIYIVWKVRWNINSDRKSQYARAIVSYPPFYAFDTFEVSTRETTLFEIRRWWCRVFSWIKRETMIIIAVIILIRLGFIACASRGRTGIYYYQTILSRVRARFTRSYTRARCTIALFLSLSMYVYMCVSGLIFIKSKCRTTASSTRSLLPRGTAINSPRVYDEAGRCRSRARDGNKIKKKKGRERTGGNE